MEPPQRALSICHWDGGFVTNVGPGTPATSDPRPESDGPPELRCMGFHGGRSQIVRISARGSKDGTGPGSMGTNEGED